MISAGFRRPALRPNVIWKVTSSGTEFSYLGCRRFIEFDFDEDRREQFSEFIVRDFSTGRYPADIGMELVCAPLTSLV